METSYKSKKEFIVNTIYILIFGVIAYFILKYGLGLLSPFILAFIISYLLQTPAKFLTKKFNVSIKAVSLLLTLLFYLSIISLMVLTGVKLISSITGFFTNLPVIYNTQIQPSLTSIFDVIEKSVYNLEPAIVEALNNGFDQIIKALGENITNMSLSLVTYFSGIASSLPSFLIKSLLMIISTFFIAGDYDMITETISRQFSGKVYEVIMLIKDYIINTLFVVIKSYIMIMSLTFIELSIGLSLIGIKNSVLIAATIAVFDILPVLGTGGIMIPWTILSFIQGNVHQGIGLAVVYIAITVIRNILEPKIVGSQLGLHPVVTLISMFVGTNLFGVLGLFGFPILFSLLKYLNDRGTINIFK